MSSDDYFTDDLDDAQLQEVSLIENDYLSLRQSPLEHTDTSVAREDSFSSIFGSDKWEEEDFRLVDQIIAEALGQAQTHPVSQENVPMGVATGALVIILVHLSIASYCVVDRPIEAQGQGKVHTVLEGNPPEGVAAGVLLII